MEKENKLIVAMQKSQVNNILSESLYKRKNIFKEKSKGSSKTKLY